MRNPMMSRRAFAVAAAASLLFAGTARAQGRAKRYRLGIISVGGNPRTAAFFQAFTERLRELGWTDGTNLTVEFEVDETAKQLSSIAAGMVRRRVDVILAAGPEVLLKAVSEATRSIPIVMVALNYDPVQKGYVASLARPGRNITGVAFRNPEVGPKQLELLQQAVPRANRVGVLWSMFSADQLSPLDAEASRLHMQLQKIELVSPYDIDKTFVALKALRLDALLALGDPIVYRQRARIADLVREQKLPAIGGISSAEAGLLMGFGPDLDGAMRRGAEYVDKILRGANAMDMPIEQPTTFRLVINLKTARVLGITMPQPLLLRADEVLR